MHDIDSWLTYCHFYILEKSAQQKNEPDDIGCACAALIAEDNNTIRK